ncbi:MAG: DUF3017 domain-containing protein [Bifidobacterium sp.]|nr:DUF3017 domain-containing protein [Bifidobacterium sp.]MCH4208546.1 DUF3017 domain-containing protein [Bifidobacterium sp.]MCI1224232.1 DUF3017 domain-containing protein [Bifidobacterium sp.]
MSGKRPQVSEDHEGEPAFEWLVVAAVALGALCALFGYMMAATAVLAATAIITGSLRLALRERSPWKVRSVAFDSIIGIGLGLGLIITYASIRLLY